VLQHERILSIIFAPVGNYILLGDGAADIALLSDGHAPALAHVISMVAIAAILLALLCFFVFLAAGRRWPIISGSSVPLPAPATTAPPVSWQNLLILVGPFSLAYLTLLVPRAAVGLVFDRYLLPLLLAAVVLLLRLFEERVQPVLPIYSQALIALFAFYSIAGTHDAFSQYRARVAAIAELHAAGIPDTVIDAGFEHNLLVHVERFGFVSDPHLPSAVPSQFAALPRECRPSWAGLVPDMVPGYRLSLDPAACGGPSGFAPVPFRGWLGLHTSTLYIDKTANLVPPPR